MAPHTKPIQISAKATFTLAGILVAGGLAAGVWAEISKRFDPLWAVVPASCGLLLALFAGVRTAAPGVIRGVVESRVAKDTKLSRLKGKAMNLRLDGRESEARELEAQADALTVELYPKERARIEAAKRAQARDANADR